MCGSISVTQYAYNHLKYFINASSWFWFWTDMAWNLCVSSMRMTQKSTFMVWHTTSCPCGESYMVCKCMTISRNSYAISKLILCLALYLHISKRTYIAAVCFTKIFCMSQLKLKYLKSNISEPVTKPKNWIKTLAWK